MPAIMDKDGNVSATCECGKELCNSDMYGMFCEDMCGHADAVKAYDNVEEMVKNANAIIDFLENTIE